MAGLYLSPFAGFNVVSQGRFDERDWSLRRQDTCINASYGPVVALGGLHLPASIRSRACIDNQQDIMRSFGLRMTNNWSVGGLHALRHRRPAAHPGPVPVKYADECFVLTASYIETFVENLPLDLRPDRTVMLRFELKHLGEFNYKTDVLTTSSATATKVRNRASAARARVPRQVPAARRCHAHATVVLWIKRHRR